MLQDGIDFARLVVGGLSEAFSGHFLAVLALAMRLSACIFALLLYQFFRGVTGPLVYAFRGVFACLGFLLAWFTAGSLLELLAFVPQAGVLVEHSYAFVFIPNLVVLVALVRLYLKVRGGAPNFYGRR